MLHVRIISMPRDYGCQFYMYVAVGIPSGVMADKLKSLLETLPGMGAVSVSRSGRCHSYVWEVNWLQVGGDRPDLTINDENVQVCFYALISTTCILLSYYTITITCSSSELYFLHTSSRSQIKSF